MYKLTLYYLLALVAAAALLSVFGLLSYHPLDIAIDLITALVFSYLSNKIFAQFFGAVTNTESALITGLILLLIVPIAFPRNILFLAAACVAAMASKYFATIDKQHIFNPAAVSVLAFSMISDHIATWWIGTPVMLPFVFVGGLLLARKIQRGKMVSIFFLTYFGVVGLFAFFQGGVKPVIDTWLAGIQHTALFFFGFVMLTEPLTSPSTEKLRRYYAAFVAILFATPNLKLLGLALTPEMALCAGNVYSYIVNPKYRLVLPLVWKKFIGNTGVFAFALSSPIKFVPGQYMEWTLPHHNTDSRGNRRYFSIASSPKEKELLLTVKFYSPSSTYKKQLQNLNKGDTIIAASLAGDFALPKDPKKKVVCIAGGVGIAPFRSMIQSLIDTQSQRDIVVFYANRTVDEIVFGEDLQKAQANGVRTIYTVTNTKQIPTNWTGEKGYVTGDMIQKYVPDFMDRIFYLSGPQMMVESSKEMLQKIGIPARHIKQDFFPGYNE